MSPNQKTAHWQYSSLVTEQEMQDSRDDLARMLLALGATGIGPADAGATATCLQQGFGELQSGVSVTRTPLCLAGKVYSSGLGTHGISDILVQLPAGGRRLTGLCGVQDSERTRGVTADQTFSVEACDKDIWRSGPQNAASPPARIDVALDGSASFILKVRGPDRRAHTDWVNLKVTLVNGRTVDIVNLGPRGSAGFSFQYAGKPSAGLLNGWRLKTVRLPEENGVVIRRVTRTDPRTGLAVTCEIRQYTRFPVIEWGLRFKNISRRATPIIEDVRSLDAQVCRGSFPCLHHWSGDYCAQDGYEPFHSPLAHDEEYRFAPVGGRGTDRAWPYYNLEWPDTERGMIVVVGWPGQWASSFRGLKFGAVRIIAGQELTHFRLLPGEQVRTPLSVAMLYRGDRERSQNLWRRWMFAHNMPRLNGKLPAPFFAAYWGSEMHQADEASQLTFFNRCVEEGVRPDVWWMDAGWYPCGGTWVPTGTWEVDRERFPRGLRSISDCVHSKKTESLVWFEPERVVPGTRLHCEHPEWLLRAGDPSLPASQPENFLLNLGNPKARKWLIKHYSTLIEQEGIDIYRQDFNFEPLPYWRANDASDRLGITEIKHVEGYLAFWKALRRRFPDMLIDSCASGGRRNDLETMRLAVPLHKTDYSYHDLPTKQAFHHTLFQWLPFFGAPAIPTDRVEKYVVRSAFAPCMLTGYDMRRRDLDYSLLRRLLAEWRQVAEFYYGDFYPLTPFSRDEKQWTAWQLHRPERGDGIVQAYRRTRCAQANCVMPLRAVDASANYEVTVLSGRGKPVQMTGRRLLDTGLPIRTAASPQAVTVLYRRVK